MKPITVLQVMVLALFVCLGFAYGVDWTVDDEKYVCDCYDVTCDGFQWLGEHSNAWLWFAPLIGIAIALGLSLVDIHFFWESDKR